VYRKLVFCITLVNTGALEICVSGIGAGFFGSGPNKDQFPLLRNIDSILTGVSNSRASLHSIEAANRKNHVET